MRMLPVVNAHVNRGSIRVTRRNEGELPPQSIPVRGQLCQFVEGWKRITNDPFVLSFVAKGYRLRFTSPPLLLQTPWEIRSPQGTQKIQGMREQISLMLQKNAISEISPDTPGFYSNIFLVYKASGGWRPVIDLKQLNHHLHSPHFRMHTISSVLSTERGNYVFKIDLQDAYFHILINPDSRKYLLPSKTVALLLHPAGGRAVFFRSYYFSMLKVGISVHVFTVSLLIKVIQKLRTTQTGEVILIAPWWPSQLWFPHLLRLSADHLRFFQYRRDLLSQQGYIWSASRIICTHGGSHAALPKEVSKLAAAPRRPSTNRMYDDKAIGRGFDPLGPTAAQIASFLYDPFDTHGLSPQTINGLQVLFSLGP